ncbi:MAG: hypothetical protein ACXVB0_10430, partial [Mucilaginibacter sp.]
FSGLLLTPALYSILLALQANFHFPQTLGSILIIYVIPYTAVISVLAGLGIFCTITILRYSNPKPNIIKLYLVLVTITLSFLGFALIHHIPELLIYNKTYYLAATYAISNVFFILVYPISFVNSAGDAKRTVVPMVGGALFYSITVWFITLLFSVPISLSIWYFTKSFHPGGSLKSMIVAIIDNYGLQMLPSVAYMLTLFMTYISTVELNLNENKRKALVMLFACPLSLPVYFYYVLFDGDLIHYPLAELLLLVLPALFVSGTTIRFMRLKPRSER